MILNEDHAPFCVWIFRGGGEAFCCPVPVARYPVPVTGLPVISLDSRVEPSAASGDTVRVNDGSAGSPAKKDLAWLTSENSVYGRWRGRLRLMRIESLTECGGVRSAALRDQITRAAMSVPTNIVEGSAHASPREFARFLQYALASVSELEGHVQLARDLELMTEQDFTVFLARIVDVRKMLHGLLKSLKATRTGQQVPGNG